MNGGICTSRGVQMFEDISILSSEVFMFGHYIEFCWDYDWNLMYCEIC